MQEGRDTPVTWLEPGWGAYVCACSLLPLPEGTLAPKPPLRRALGGPPCTHQPCASCQSAFPATLGLPCQRQEAASGPDEVPVMSRGPCEPWPMPQVAPRLRHLGLGAGSGPSSAQRPPSLRQDPGPPASPPPRLHALTPSPLPRAHHLGFPARKLCPASSTGAPHSPARWAPGAQLSEGAEGTLWSPSHHAPPSGPGLGSYSGIFSICTQPLRLSSDGLLSVHSSPPTLGSLNALGQPRTTLPQARSRSGPLSPPSSE